MPETNYLTELPTPQHVLAIYAHPDDAEFFAGGTMAKWAADGVRLTLFLITSGDKGSNDRNELLHHAIADNREAEAIKAAHHLGIQEVIFLRRGDGELLPTIDLRRHIVRMIRLKQPDAVLSSDPLRRWFGKRSLNHPDHYIVAEAVQNAVYPAARDHLNFLELYTDEGLEPHITRWLYLALPTEANYRVETTAYRETQIEALTYHASQIGNPTEFKQYMATRYDQDLTNDEANPRYAEYFRVIDLSRPQSDETPKTS